MRVLVLSGGRSAEREISFLSAKWVSQELKAAGHHVTDIVVDQNGSWMKADSTDVLSIRTGEIPWNLFNGDEKLFFDVIFPVLHGSYGEDGTVQGLCATAGWPCAGTPVMGSAVAMEKHTLKKLASQAGIPVVPWVFLDENTDLSSLMDETEALGFPVFVKPSRLGSSVGVAKVETPEELSEAVENATKYDSMVLIEKAVEPAREIEVSVAGGSDGIFSSVPGEVLPGGEWYDYKAKYSSEESLLVIPAEVTASQRENFRMMAENVFRMLGGRGFARVDFFMNADGVWLNEVNTIPGFTSISMFPKLWEATGMDSGKLMNFILEEALSRVEYGLELEYHGL